MTTQDVNKQVRVVAGLFWRERCVLVQQRPAHKPQGLLWEFPGGKVEPGESDAAALQRECFEELGVSVRVGTLAWKTTHVYDDVVVTLCLYHASMDTDAQPVPLQAARLAWQRPQALKSLEFCPADVPLVRELTAGLHRPPR